jgi:flagellar FliJ protein
MQRFIFTLEPVRALREQAERQAQEALARELLLQQARRAQLQEAARRTALARRRAAAGSRTSGRDLQSQQAYLERTERDEASARDVLARQEQVVADERGRLLAAAQEREAMERLKRRRRAEHARDALRIETDMLGEVGLQSHRRASMGRAA